jgi:hypothetical protein
MSSSYSYLITLVQMRTWNVQFWMDEGYTHIQQIPLSASMTFKAWDLWRPCNLIHRG